VADAVAQYLVEGCVPDMRAALSDALSMVLRALQPDQPQIVREAACFALRQFAGAATATLV
jgi:hypothetical protein